MPNLIATTKPKPAGPIRLAKRIWDLEKTRIGLLVNGRDYAGTLASEIAQCYQERHQCTVAGSYDKGDGAVPCAAAQLGRLNEISDFVIAAVGDDESHAEWLLRDSFALEQMGTPVICICTKAVKTFAVELAEEMGIQDYPLIAVHHPVDALSSSEMAARALHAYQQGWASLTGAFSITV